MLEFYKGRYCSPGQKVFVYFNLHKACLSLKALNGPFKGKVIAHAYGTVELANCHFLVNESGRLRVLAEKKKNVHAGVCGELLFGYEADVAEVVNETIYYNPYKTASFMNTKQQAAHTAELVQIDGKLITAFNVNGFVYKGVTA